MKSQRRTLSGIAALAVLTSLTFAAMPASAASVGEGKPCSPVGKVATAGGEIFTCTKSGSKLVWKKPTTADVKFTMPNLRGQVLQKAQDKLQSLGSFLLDQEDASGRGRLQVLDRNWKVCRQDPKAGTKVSIADIVTLWSVKLSESC